MTFPPRSIISLKACPDEDCLGVVIGCDCGMTTHLAFELDGPVPDGQEVAFTCDGCHSTHWATLRQTEG